MSLLPGFDPERPAFASRLGPRLLDLAQRGVSLGTSSWKYEGWLGTIYNPERYETRGKFSLKKFQDECLAEYAGTFPVVGGDFSFYQFPKPDSWERLFASAPETLQFALKVPEEITVPTWPGHARYGKRAGQPNPSFLDARLFELAFLRPLARYSGRVAVLMFEFGTLPKKTFPTPTAFRERLAPFLDALPPGPRYSVEVRNAEYLEPAYLDLLRDRNVAHVYNAWTRMPHLADQIDMPGSETADFLVARALLKRGQGYEQATADLEPYSEVKAPCPPVREALAAIAGRAIVRRKPAFVLVNNHLEGFAPGTIEAVVDGLESRPEG
ncbi:MAG: DUF72 domain-containing protein [Isosphaeraceae bacterium]